MATDASSSSSSPSHGVPAGWTAGAIPSLTDKTAIVTGATSGIGFETALQLALHGAHVVLACRDAVKADAAATRIREAAAAAGGSTASVEAMMLDTSSLQSVRAFAAQFRATHGPLHLLINNAGVMGVPLSLSADGHERQFATNHLGHFALTAQLFDRLQQAAPDARVVCVSSLAHREGAAVPRERVMEARAAVYAPTTAYAQSKLYNLLMAKELARRMQAAGVSGVRAVACHPGLTSTNLMAAPLAEHGWFKRQLFKLAALAPIYQDAATGALPTLYAATGAGVASGDYYGPGGVLALWGAPKLEQPAPVADSEEFASVVWEESERLAGIKFDVQ